MSYKHRIIAFIWHDLVLAIDWENRKSAFDITRQHGDAGFFHQPDGPGTFGVMSAIGSAHILSFVLRNNPETGLVEVILKVDYEPNEKSLGLTDQAEEAERWVRDANNLVQQIRNKE